MIRVLVTGAENIGVTGVATAAFRWGQAFDHEHVIYDYLMIKRLPNEKYQQQIRNTGGNIYKNPYMDTIHGELQTLLWVFHTFRRQREQVLHINASWCYEAFPLVLTARLAGMRKIVVHSHSSYVDSNKAWIRRLKVMAHYFFRPYIVSKTGLKLACSREAAEWMYGNKVIQNHMWEKVYNSVDLDKYRFDPTNREIHRKELGIPPNGLLVGSIGRLSYAKNYEFLIDVMSELVKKRPEAKLLLVGVGGYQTMLEAKANELGIRNNVVFAGSRTDANELLSAIDVFVLPSRFEGLPLVLIEAQVAKLPCVVSDCVTKECKLTESLVYLRTSDKKKWASTIVELSKTNRDSILVQSVEPYTDSNSAQKLQTIYMNYLNGK